MNKVKVQKIRLTKDHKKQSGGIVKKGTVLTVSDGHPFKNYTPADGEVEEKDTNKKVNTKK